MDVLIGTSLITSTLSMYLDYPFVVNNRLHIFGIGYIQEAWYGHPGRHYEGIGLRYKSLKFIGSSNWIGWFYEFAYNYTLEYYDDEGKVKNPDTGIPLRGNIGASIIF